MAVVRPTSATVWDHHPALRMVEAAFAETVASRQGRVVLLAGGPASGRTGLAHALATRLAAHPARPVVVAGGFTPDGDWEPWPPSDPAQLVARLQTGVDLAVNALELGGTLGLPGGTAAAKLLGQVAGTSSAAWTLLSEHAEGKQRLPGPAGPDAVRAVLRAAAGPQLVIGWQPVACIFDDLDRAPTAQQWWSGLLVRLAGELRDLPLLLVASLDGPVELGGHELGEPAGLWAARRLVDAGVGIWVPVGRLDVDAVAAWLGACEPELAVRLWEVTGGEPRWLGELWEHWQASRVVRRDLTGQWVLAAADHPTLGKVNDLLWERLARCYGGRLDDDQLDAVVRALAVGALEGREFTAQAVALVVGRDADELIDDFDEHLLVDDDRPDGLLEEAGFVQLADPRTTPDDGEGVLAVCRYRFAAELHWRTLRRYGLHGRERQADCRALAAALEGVLQPEPERAAVQIANLLREAGDHQAAASWQTQAELGTAVPLAEAHARLLLAQDSGGWEWSDHAQAAKQFAYVTGLLLHRQPAGAVLRVAQGWAQAAQAAGWQSEYARALLYCGLLHHRRGELDAAVACFRQSRRKASAAGDVALAAHAMVNRAKAEMDQGRVRVARRRAEAARQLAHHNAPREEAGALRWLAELALRSGDYKGALATAAAGVAAAERAVDPEALVLVLQALSDAQHNLGSVGQAQATAARALEVARQAGIRSWEGWSEALLGGLWAAEDPEAAERHLLRGLAIARQLDHYPLGIRCRVMLARLAHDRGEMRRARDTLGQATRLARTFGDPYLTAGVWQGWAELAEAQGAPGGQAAILLALAALHSEQAAQAAGWWEEAERAAVEAGEPGGRAGLAARAQAALAHDSGWGLLEEVFGSVGTDEPDGDQATPGT